MEKQSVPIVDAPSLPPPPTRDISFHYREVYRIVAETELANGPGTGCKAGEEYVRSIYGSGLSLSEYLSLTSATAYINLYRHEGVITLRHIMPKEWTRRAIDDIWDNGILSLPWTDELKAEWQTIRESFRADPWRVMSKADANRAIEIYPMTGGFGALTMPPAFHLATQWEARQDPVMVTVGRALLVASGAIPQPVRPALDPTDPGVLVSLDRVSLKFPGQGETEFCHWDSDPFSWPEEPYEGMQGILSLSNTSFRAVPRTHTEEFRQRFIALYPQGKRKDQYHVLSQHDPLGLRKSVREYPLRPGDYVVWSNRLLHEARINRTSFVRYGFFIQYIPAHLGPAPAVLDAHRPKKIVGKGKRKDKSADAPPEPDDALHAWYRDRQRSYETGGNPHTFPSGTTISLYSQRSLMSHPQSLDTFCAMFTTPPTPYTYKTGKKKGQVVNLPSGWNPLEEGSYTPPPLSELGQYLLLGSGEGK